MKHLFKVLLISLAFVGCKQKIQSTDISKINGYWEIEKVVFDQGEDKEYGANQNYDFFQIDKNAFSSFTEFSLGSINKCP